MTANLDILIRAQNQASSALNAVRGDLNALERAAGTAGRGFGGLQTIMGSGLKVAAGAAAAGVLALGAGFGAATVDGFRINSTLENVRAQLVAFTKDGDLADQMLADIREEAARTPFAFEELAKATASLLPASIQSGIALEDLIQQAEILAASNPAQGLEGAAFSLREALSGDFVSIIDRFNLPRTRLNELKAEGVPAMEAITIAMREMGLDASLVAGMALTMTGRWSTFKDTMDTVKAALAKPLFDRVKEGLSKLQPVLDANMPRMLELATLVGDKLAAGVEWLVRSALSAATALSGMGGAIQGVISRAGEMLGPVLDVAGAIASAVGSFVSWKDVLGAVGIVLASIVIPALAGMVAAAAPVILVAAALVAGVALLRNAWERDWGGIQEKTAAAVAAIQPYIEMARSWLATAIPAALATLRAAFTSLLADIQMFWRVVQGLFAGDPFATEVASQRFGTLGYAVVRLVEIFQTTKAAIVTAWAALVAFLSPAIDRIVAAFGPMMESIEPLGGKFAALGEAAMPVINAIVAALGWLSQGFMTVAAVLVDVLLNTFAAVMPQAGVIVGAMVDQVTALLTLLTNAFTAGVALVKAIIDGDWAGAWAAAQTLFGAFFTYYDSTLTNMLTIGTSILTAIKDVIVNTLTDLGVDVGPILDTITGLWEGATGLWNGAISGVTGAIDSISTAIGSARGAMEGFMSWLGGIKITNPFAGWSMPSIPGIPGFATGTQFAPGGMAMVGERGPELVALPRGSRVYNAEQTARAGQGGINVTINASVADGIDMESLAYRIASMIQQKQRGGAYGAA
jgi:hypothetical protein